MPHARVARRYRGTAQLPVSAARLNDYLLGGAHNFHADRAAASELVNAIPSARTDVWAGRAFTRRAVARLCARGVRQFLDLGSGIPSAGSVHELARNLAPDARVVYVDADPVVVEHTRTALANVSGTAVLHEDLRDAELVLSNKEVADILDFSHPIGLLMTGVLQFVPDHDDPSGLLAAYTDALATGSHLVVTHAAPGGLDDAQVAVATRIYEGAGTPLILRTPEQLAELVDGYTLVPAADEEGSDDSAPVGVVPVHQWRPDPLETEIATSSVYGAVMLTHAPGDQPARPVTGSAAPRLLGRSAVGRP